MNQQESVPHFLYRSLKHMPGLNALLHRTWWKLFRHRLTLALGPRQNCRFTSFLRLPTQFEALSGPVLDFLMQDGSVNTLKITVIGCSIGAEAYSIASVLRERHPNLIFAVYAYDIDSECIKKAKSARYTPQEVFSTDQSGHTSVTADFIEATFQIEDGTYVVKSELRKHVQCEVADALNSKLKEHIGTSDIVFAQHVLIHLQSQKAKVAFKNLYRLLNPKAVLFIAGMDLNSLQKQTRKYNLRPSEYKMSEIHREVRAYSGGGWPWDYNSVEPFMAVRKEWQRRYSTIFFRSSPESVRAPSSSSERLDGRNGS